MHKKVKTVGMAIFTALAVVVLVLTAALSARLIAYDAQTYTRGESIHHLTIQGEYSEEGGPWQPLTRQTKFDNMQLRDITVRGHFSRDIPEKALVFLKIDHVWVSLRVNDHEVFRCIPQEGDGNPTRALGRQWSNFASQGITAQDQVELRFGNLYRNAHIVQFDSLLWNLHTGDSGALLYHAWQEDGVLMGIGVVFLCLAALLLAAAFFALLLRVKVALQFVLLGFVAFFAGTWFCTLTPSITLFVPFPVFLNVLYAYSLQGITIFLTLFFACGMTGLRRVVLVAVSGVLMLMLAVDLLRQMHGVQDLYDAINHFTLLDVMAAFVILGAVLYEKYVLRRKSVNHQFKVIFVILLCGILELLNGYFQFVQASVFLGVGLLLAVLTEGVWLAQWIAHTIRNEKRIITLESELAQKHMSLMLSQIQPHFLYNALVGIKQLCDTDPAKASDALEHFSYYLRGNLDSLTQERLIPFAKELEHVRDYLYLEKMRFENRLHVRWELSAQDFLLPPLTLQPLVENAVRHGITKKETGGTLVVRSEKTADGVLVTIADDGVGFDQAAPPEDARTHVGLENVRQRVEAQCAGWLRVESRVGQGTQVMVFIPQKEAQ